MAVLFGVCLASIFALSIALLGVRAELRGIQDDLKVLDLEMEHVSKQVAIIKDRGERDALRTVPSQEDPEPRQPESLEP